MALATAAATVTVVVTVVFAVTAVHGEEQLRNVIITSFGELPYEPAPMGAGGFFQADVLPVSLNGDVGLPQTMDVALRTRILVEDPNEKKTSDASEENYTEDVAKSSSTNRQVSDTKNSLDQNKAKEIEEELLTARTKSGLRKLNGQRDTQENSKPDPSVPRSSIYQYRQTKTLNPHHNPIDSNGYNINTEYYGDLGEGWNLEDAEEILQGRNYNILIQNPHGYNPKNYPPPPPPPAPREIPPPRFPPSFYPFPGFGYKPIPPPSFGSVGLSSSGRNSRDGYYRSSKSSRAPPRLREDIVYGRAIDSEYQPSRGRKSSAPYIYYDDYLSGA